ncbi:MAG: S41 family peptidase [Ginsengibacter sp.]
MKKLIIITSFIIFTFTSCQKALLGPVVSNKPVNNFEEMWKGYDAWYGGFEVRHINWDSIYKSLRPEVNNNMTNQQLYDVLSRMIKPLNDIHVFLQPTSDDLPRYESSIFFRNNKVQHDFSIKVIKENYLPQLITVDDNLHYGILDGNIGYLHFAEFGMPLSFYKQKMPGIMNALKNTKAMIVDIRNHAGGDDEVSRYIAGLFAKNRALFMTTRKRNGPGRNDFTAPDKWYVEKQGDFQYTNPVILLTTRWTASAGETFTWAMNTQPEVTQMGDTTAGGFTDVISRELPNGWLYFVGVGDYRDASGKSEEGIGVAPKIYAINSKSDIDAGKDKVLEQAIDSLK